jgi:hypothetical protein
MDENGFDDRSRQSDAAVQYLIWAIEEIERLGGHPQAAVFARFALIELRDLHAEAPNRYADEAKRFRDEADEAEQLADLANDGIQT